jgi:hypothetical protein
VTTLTIALYKKCGVLGADKQMMRGEEKKSLKNATFLQPK